jgi:hypothetical protein
MEEIPWCPVFFSEQVVDGSRFLLTGARAALYGLQQNS